MGEFFFTEAFEPRLKPREYVQIGGRFYEVVETRPMLPWRRKWTKIEKAIVDVDLRTYELKGVEAEGKLPELLNFRLRVRGPVTVLVRLEGAGGPIFGGWGAAERRIDENTPPHLLEFLVLGERTGWLLCKIEPLVVPAWCQLSAYGYVYKVRPIEERPSVYAVPAYISGAVKE